MKAVFLSKCQPKGENVLFCESVILLLWYPSILLTPLARYYKDVRILLQMYLFIYFAQRKREKKKTSPRLKPSFIYLLFCFICLCYYLFIVFFLMYKRVMKCIMVGANNYEGQIRLYYFTYYCVFSFVSYSFVVCKM